MNIIFEAQGGIGKNIIATVIIELLRKKYPKDTIVVIASFPEIFDQNPNIDYLYSCDNRIEPLERFVHNQENNCKVFIKDPYFEDDFINSRFDIYEIWAKICGLEYNKEKPKLYFNLEGRQFKKDKPILVIHPHGGLLFHDNKQVRIDDYNWARDLPIKLTQKIIDFYKDEYDVYVIKHQKQKVNYKNAIMADYPLKEIATLLSVSDKRILIDSFAQHMAAALDLPSTVCWITTKSNVLGYNIHNNIQANHFEFITKQRTYFGYDFVEPLYNLPYTSTENIFNLNQIIK